MRELKSIESFSQVHYKIHQTQNVEDKTHKSTINNNKTDDVFPRNTPSLSVCSDELLILHTKNN